MVLLLDIFIGLILVMTFLAVGAGLDLDAGPCMAALNFCSHSPGTKALSTTDTDAAVCPDLRSAASDVKSTFRARPPAHVCPARQASRRPAPRWDRRWWRWPAGHCRCSDARGQRGVHVGRRRARWGSRRRLTRHEQWERRPTVCAPESTTSWRRTGGGRNWSASLDRDTRLSQRPAGIAKSALPPLRTALASRPAKATTSAHETLPGQAASSADLAASMNRPRSRAGSGSWAPISSPAVGSPGSGRGARSRRPVAPLRPRSFSRELSVTYFIHKFVLDRNCSAPFAVCPDVNEHGLNEENPHGFADTVEHGAGACVEHWKKRNAYLDEAVVEEPGTNARVLLHPLLDDAPHDHLLGLRARAVVEAYGEAIGTRSWGIKASALGRGNCSRLNPIRRSRSHQLGMSALYGAAGARPP